MKLTYDGEVFLVPFGCWWKWYRRDFKRMIAHAVLFPFEWAGIFIGIAVLSSLTYRMLLSLCDFIALVYYTFDREGRRTAEKNLCIMFPEGLETSRKELVIRRSYRNMCRSIGYAFWTFRRARRRCVVAGELSPECVAFLAANRPAVTASGHLGCWEILSQLAFLSGHEMMSVAKDIGTRGMTRMLMRARRSIGQEIVPAEGAFKPLMAGIKSGKSLGLLVDQVVEPAEGGIPMKFFGREYYVSPAPAFFAAKAKAPIAVAWSRPLQDGRYRCELIDMIPAGEARDIREATQRITSALEGVVRRHPSCWPLNYDYFKPVWSADKEREMCEQSKRYFKSISAANGKQKKVENES